MTYKILLEVAGISLELVCISCQRPVHGPSLQSSLTANNSNGIPTQANIGEFQAPEEFIRTVRLGVDCVVGREDAEGPNNLVIDAVPEEVLPNQVATNDQSLRVWEIGPDIPSGNWIVNAADLVIGIVIHKVTLPPSVHVGIELGIFLLKKLRGIREHWCVASVLAVLVGAHPAVPIDAAIAAAAFGAHEATTEGEFCAVKSIVARQWGYDRRYLTRKRSPLLDQSRGVGETLKHNWDAVGEDVIILALAIETEPASGEYLLAVNSAALASMHRRLGNQIERGVGLCGGLTLSSPPRRLGQIRLLKANAPDLHGFVPACGNLCLLPHVGDVEVTKDCIWMRRLARVKGMVFSFKGG